MNNYLRKTYFKVNTVTRPYTFIEFDTYIQRARRAFSDGGRARRNMTQLGPQLQDVQRIMVQNIDDVLQRGAVLSGIFFKQFILQHSIYVIGFSLTLLFSELDTKTQNLSMLSQKYKKDATYLNSMSMYVKASIAGILFLVVILYFWIL